MPSLLVLATVAAVLTVALAAVDPSGATPPPKQPDLVTTGASARPDPPSASEHAHAALAHAPAPARATLKPARLAKPESFGVSSPSDASLPSDAQREKRAAAVAAPAAPEMAGAKPPELSTVLPPAAGAGRAARGAPPKSPFDLESASLRPAAARHALGALGSIPRPEWTMGRSVIKPDEVQTQRPADARGVPVAPPSAAELQSRAVRRGAAPAARKPESSGTSKPRDPALPPASPTKVAPEVKP